MTEVTVLGAGIAGLAAALALRDRGVSVEIVEQAERLTEVGAGLQIAPNGTRVLRALGIDPPGPESRAVHLIDGPTGRSLIRMPLGPGFHLVHRADLIEALAARLGDIPLHLGRPVAGVSDGGRRLDFSNGQTRAVRRLIGADGARGASRHFVAPDHAARWTGQVAWRALVPVAGWPAEAQVHVGPGRHLVLYPLRDGRLLNVVAVEERAEWVAEGWSQEDDPQALRDAFANYAGPVREVLSRVERVHLWGLMDHGAVPAWRRGACTLIGDAAHPTLPFLAQGANLALEDAWTLAAAGDPAAWEAARRGRVTRALATAQANARNYHLTGMRRALGHGALRAVGAVAPRAMLRRYDWLYGHDVTV
ncbi:FAD-dependent monooxygenase [Jannaschia formosa]|uniref:FAD-dependent monooxygenase n=1 Tax=Jannaschia formosa TaxID=2259592 RepID=UPI000E1C2BCA|nr:FAD-dependent monooxygenase [Jannaschia formosa]TFL19808.1 FAD-binding protein [Jannaschia formosa]